MRADAESLLLHLPLFVLLLRHDLMRCWSIPVHIMEPDHILFYVGENLTLHCFSESGFVGEVYFVQGNTNLSTEYVEQVNTTYARFNKLVTGNDPRKAKYFCKATRMKTVVAQTKHLKTDYFPQKATDLRMVYLDETILKITWSYGNTTYKFDYTSMVVRVTAEWSFNPSDSKWTRCYSNRAKDAGCEVNLTDNYNDLVDVHVRVNVTNVNRKDSASITFPGVRIRNYVKPSPVDSVDIEECSKRKVRLNVTTQNVGNLVFYVTYSAKEDGERKITMNESSDKSFEIPGLHPHYNYTFEVRSKYAGRGYLSDPKKISFQMPEDAPAAAPAITPGAFFLDNPPASSHCSLYIYYQEVAKEDRNGVITDYEGRLVDSDHTVVQSGSHDSPRTMKMNRVPCGEAFGVEVLARTKEGSSPTTLLSVPTRNQELDREVQNLGLSIKVVRGNVTAEWNPLPSAKGASFLLYYCEPNSSDNNMCQDPVMYDNITAIQTGRLPLMLAKAHMKFGVAAVLRDGASNGIKFTNCLYDPDKPTLDAPSNLRAEVTNDRGILVSWMKEEVCNTIKRVIIHNYIIEACVTGSGSNQCRRYTHLAGRPTTFRLPDVEKDQRYRVRVRANTSSSLTAFSQPAYATVSSPEINIGHIAGITSAVLVSVTLLGIVIFRIRWSYKAKKSLFNSSLAVPVLRPNQTVPHRPNHNSNKLNNDTETRSLVLSKTDSGYDEDNSISFHPTTMSTSSSSMVPRPGIGYFSVPTDAGQDAIDSSLGNESYHIDKDRGGRGRVGITNDGTILFDPTGQSQMSSDEESVFNDEPKASDLLPTVIPIPLAFNATISSSPQEQTPTNDSRGDGAYQCLGQPSYNPEPTGSTAATALFDHTGQTLTSINGWTIASSDPGPSGLLATTAAPPGEAGYFSPPSPKIQTQTSESSNPPMQIPVPLVFGLESEDEDDDQDEGEDDESDGQTSICNHVARNQWETGPQQHTATDAASSFEDPVKEASDEPKQQESVNWNQSGFTKLIEIPVPRVFADDSEYTLCSYTTQNGIEQENDQQDLPAFLVSSSCHLPEMLDTLLTDNNIVKSPVSFNAHRTLNSSYV